MRSYSTNAFLALATIFLVAERVMAGEVPAEPWVAACWLVQEGKGDTVLDHSGHGNHGKVNRAAWVQADGKAVLKFTPADKSRVDIPNSPSLNLTEMITIDVYVKTYGSTGTWQGIVTKNNHGNEQQKIQYQLILNDRLELLYGVCTGGPANFWIPSTNIILQPNKWYHVVATYDAFRRQVILTVDGVERKRLVGAPLVQPSDNPVYLGWTAWSNEFLNGEIHDVRIVNILAEKIAALKAKGVDHCVLFGTDYLPHQFTAGAEALSGILNVTLLNPRDTSSRATLHAKIGEKTLEQTQEIRGGRLGRVECVVPELPTEVQAHIELTEQGKTIATNTVAIPGAKDYLGYRGFVVSHSHSDVSWTDTPEVCLNLNLAAIAKSVEIAEKQPHYRFSLENVHSLREYVRRHPDKVELLKRLMREGRFECGAFFTGPWELTCGGEGLIRQMYLGKLWVKKHLGSNPNTVWNVDVAGHTAQLPQILQKAGIRGLVISAGATDNTFTDMYLLHETRGPFLFRWQAPDGSSIPTWSTAWGYASGAAFGIRSDSVDAAVLAEFVDDVRKNQIAHGLPKIAFITDGTDNETPSARTGENIQKWNAEKRFPPLVSASTAELFGAVEREPLPTYAGEMPSPWDQVQSQANECFMLDRRLEGRLLAAEKFATFANVVSPNFAYPHEQFNKIWENRLFTLEHNWGGKNGNISDRWKTDKIREATTVNDAILRSAFQSLANTIRFGRPDALRMVVFNPLSWDRKDIVTCTLPVPEDRATKMAIVDSTGAVVPHQLVRRDPAAAEREKTQVAFYAEVPSLGYATYYVTGEKAAPPAASPFQVDVERNRFENDFYRIVVDSATGGIRSLYDKRRQKELVRQDGKYACNELVARENDEVDIKTHLTGKQWLMREHPSSVKVTENGPVRLVVEVAGQFMDHSTRKQEVVLYRDLARVDLVTTIGWEGKKNIDVYQAFPLSAANPTVKYAVPYGWQEYGKEMKYAAPWPFGPVAGYHWRGVRGWIEAGEAKGSVTLASECNMTAFKDLAAQPEPGYLIQPLLLKTVRSCGDGNYFYTQQGEHRFRFALQSQVADSARFGEEHSSPLLVHLVQGAAPASASLPDRLSFGRVSPDNVQVAVVKRAEDGPGLVLRLVETAGLEVKGRARVQFFKPITGIVKTNILEENEADAAGQEGNVPVPIRPFGIETFRVVF